MSWFNNFSPPSWPEFLKHQFCTFLLNRHLEEYVEDGLSQDQLKLNIISGHLDIININLDVQTCNNTAEIYNLPVELISGFIEKITISIPWKALFKESCYIEVTGLRLTLQPKQRSETSTSMFQSVLSSMTSSIAKEYLQDVKNTPNSQTVEGVEIFARSIESILNRVKIRLVDTVIRFEHAPSDSNTGLAMEIWIKNFEYSDQAGCDSASEDPNEPANGYVVSAFVTKRIHLEGVTFHIDEFSSRSKVYPTNTMSRESTPDSKNSSDGQYSSAQISPSNRVSTPPEKSTINNSSESNPIIFAKLSGRQEIRFKYKQSENALGPKKEILVTLGSFTSFLSPRQVHVLSELIRGLAWPDTEETSNVPRSRPTCVEKPMVKMDFNRVENELLNQMKSTKGLRPMDLRHTQGWSTASVDDSDNEDEFLPMSAPGATSMNNSVTSNNSSMDGSFSGSSVSLKSSVTMPKQHKHRHSIDTDPSAETMQLHVQIASLAVVLLHEDILATGIDGLTKASVKVMKSTAENFFEKLGLFGTSGFGNKDFENATKIFGDACRESHLRLLAAPLVVESSEKINNHHSSMSGNLTLASLELIEYLIEKTDNQRSPSTTVIELLTFHKDISTNLACSNKTDFEMRFNYTKKAVRHGVKTKFSHPRTEFNIILGPCQVEFDITIIDRISALLNPKPIFAPNSAYGSARGNINQQTLFDQAVESPSLPDTRVDIRISSTKCALKIRFPIPDLRPVHDMNRVPWYKRSVRPDYATLHLTDAKVHTCIESRMNYSARHEIQCRNLLLTYTKADSNLPVEIGMATPDECRNDGSSLNEAEGFNWPRIVITVYPKHYEAPLDDSSEGEPESGDSFENTPKPEPSPFSSKKVVHESDIRQNPKSQNQNEKEGAENRGGEELIIPGNRQEMTEFIEEGTRNSRIQIEIGLPCASVQIPSKYLYELIYNRFNTDLLLWEPSAYRPKYHAHAEANIGLDFSTLLHESFQPKFSMCKSGIQYDSDSDSDEEGVFYPASERANSKQKQNFNSKNGQSKIAVTLNINQGLLTMHTPVRDSMQKVIPGQQGEIMLRLKDATVFSVSKYKGDDNLGYMCSMVKDVTLYHCGLVTTSSQDPTLKSTNSVIPKHCLRSIYRTEPGANICMNFIEKDMLSVAVKIQAADDTRKIKTFKVAVGISNATLRHRVSSTAGSWFTQLRDCLDVMDYPIAGYNPPGVLTELYCHLWDCAIDYRPLHLPLRSLITIGSFSISSNIAAQTNTLTLRFIAEDMALFLSNKTGKVVKLKQDYVSVIDFGLFEVSLRLNEKMCGGAPKVELRATNNVFHIRTCSDSCRALMQLLTYFAYDGDLTPNTDSTESITVPSSEDGESLLEDESINTLSKRQIERVNSLMEDAMEEPCNETTDDEERKPSNKSNQCQTKVFYFPGESNSAAVNDALKNTNTTSTNSYAKIDQQDDYDDGDEDFCILGEEAGVGIVPRTGVPEIRWLGEEIVRVVENHFSVPLGKTDVLKSPKNFPSPIFRYTLCEMTLIWHMYGGKDFEDPQPAAKKHITINENSNNYGRSRSAVEGVGYSKSSPNRVNFGSAPNSPRTRGRETNSWQMMGGPGRRHDILMELQLNKIRFQHEIYPENEKIASRQVFVVNEFEIRDRLTCSQINKFLYLYSSNARPRRSHAHMFTVKANYIRPDQKLTAQECSLKVSLLPLRLNIDQDSLLFLITFFTELCGGPNETQEISTIPNHIQSTPGSKQGTPTHQRPVMSVNDNDDMNNSINENEDIDRNLMTLLEDELTIKEKKSSAKIVNETQESGQPIYFRSVVFSSEGFLKLDYHSKRVLLSHGTVAALLMSIGDLQNIELKLKRLTNRHGILGFDKLLRFIIQEWTDDIKSQVPSIIGGIGPLHSILKLYEGVRDLIWLPIEQYQKDGRIVRGLQRGTYNFSSSTMHAFLVLTERLVSVIHTGAATAFDLVNPGPSVRCKSKGTKGKRKRFNHPLDIREGMNNACQLVREGFGDTYCQLVRVASEEHEQKGVSGAVGGVLRQLAPSVVAPITICCEATSNVLGGMVSQLVPDARYEATQKWKKDDDFHEINNY